jgi:hypothetical protein
LQLSFFPVLFFVRIVEKLLSRKRYQTFKLDDFVELPRHKGSFAILRATYGSDSFGWG